MYFVFCIPISKNLINFFWNPMTESHNTEYEEMLANLRGSIISYIFLGNSLNLDDLIQQCSNLYGYYFTLFLPLHLSLPLFLVISLSLFLWYISLSQNFDVMESFFSYITSVFNQVTTILESYSHMLILQSKLNSCLVQISVSSYSVDSFFPIIHTRSIGTNFGLVHVLSPIGIMYYMMVIISFCHDFEGTYSFFTSLCRVLCQHKQYAQSFHKTCLQ